MHIAAANDDAVWPDGNDAVVGGSTMSVRSNTSKGLGRSTRGLSRRSATMYAIAIAAMTAIPVGLQLLEQVITNARMNHRAAWVASNVIVTIGPSRSGDAP